MGCFCDFCGEQRSIVYCRSDVASLCLSCDRNIHSANALSRRHSRTLVCERCNSQPASVRCTEERMSLCQNCDWIGHSNCPSHNRQAVNCYSGCPSSAELSSIWSFLLDSMEDPSLLLESSDQLHNGAAGSSTPHGKKGDGSFYDEFNMDEIDFGIENYDELFGGALDEDPQASCSKPVCSNTASADSVMSCKTEPPNGSLPQSGLTGDTSTGDFQDSGPNSSIPIPGRSDAVKRYQEKKKIRKFEKKVRYKTRKARADTRRRVKGRFIKAGDAYDYDPLMSPTRSY